MKNTLTYNGYQARVDFDPDDEILVGRIAGINDNIGFHADTVEGLVAAFHEAVDDYVETCAEIGKTPERSYSGNVYLRVDEELHSMAAMAAELSGCSLNEFGEVALRDAVLRYISQHPSAPMPSCLEAAGECLREDRMASA